MIYTFPFKHKEMLLQTVICYSPTDFLVIYLLIRSIENQKLETVENLFLQTSVLLAHKLVIFSLSYVQVE